ncbi:MAG: DUF5074 domain-containing protein [Rikenellaceae bacterium]
MTKTTLKIIFLLLLFATSCRKEEEIIPSTSTEVTDPDNEDVVDIKGFFLLNEGNMGNNKCTLDYFDYQTGVYTKNIYAERNPGVVKELGDVGNDIQIYGDRLYCVINCSNFVEIMDLATAKHIAVVSIPNCRYIVFKDDYAYVSSYAGPVLIDPNARLGYVAKVDLNTLEVVGECAVGYQPDELVIVGDKLYVANSGGYRVPNYDNTVSVIDLETFTETKQIEVAINLHRLELDNYGYLWVSSRGDYYDTPSKTFVLDPRTDEVIKEFDLANSNMWLDDDLLYVYSTEWSWYSESMENTYALIDTKSQALLDTNFIIDGTQKNIVIPYGVAVNPETKEILVTDAKDYVTPGKLHCYSSDGVLKWSVTTGDIPAHIAFTTVQLEPLNN